MVTRTRHRVGAAVASLAAVLLVGWAVASAAGARADTTSITAPAAATYTVTTASVPHGQHTPLTFAGQTGTGVVADGTGLVILTAQVQFAPSGTGDRIVQVAVDGAVVAYAGQRAISVGATGGPLTATVEVTAGQRIDVTAYQSSGGTLALSRTAPVTLTITWLTHTGTTPKPSPTYVTPTPPSPTPPPWSPSPNPSGLPTPSPGGTTSPSPRPSPSPPAS